MVLRIVEGYPLLQVGAGRDELAEMKQRNPERIVDVQEARGAVHVLHECEALLAEFSRRMKIAPHHIKRMQSEQYLEQPWRFPQVLTELAGPGVGVFHLWGGIALNG